MMGAACEMPNPSLKWPRFGNYSKAEELASRAGVSRQTIISIEKNKFVPGLDVAMKISSSLNTPIDKLFYFV